MPLRHSRRDFLRTGVAGGALLTLPAAVYRGAFAADPPSERIRLGFIGVGNQGGPKNNLKHFIPHASIVALCDVDTKYLAEAAAFVEKGSNKPLATFGDYR